MLTLEYALINRILFNSNQFILGRYLEISSILEEKINAISQRTEVVILSGNVHHRVFYETGRLG